MGFGLSGLQATGINYSAQQRIDGANDQIYDLANNSGFENSGLLAKGEKFASLNRTMGFVEAEVAKKLNEQHQNGPSNWAKSFRGIRLDTPA
ncbi:MAG: hypothetical protein QE263_07055 [Vampirovibrionales bacterium]|nr:hypothetical protein [Vampirovibrionales bacterium]